MALNIMRYTLTHQWLRVNKPTVWGTVVTIGLTHKGQAQLGPIRHILPNMRDGATIKVGNQLSYITGTKGPGLDFVTPIAGTLLEFNPKLTFDNFQLINRSPEDEGWLYKIRLPHDYRLLDADDYEEHC